MPDVFTKTARSGVMAGERRIAGQAAVFRRHGITGWRRQREIRSSRSEARSFRVKPDFVFPKLRLAVFVDGCFWHGCPKHATWPSNRAAWWRLKIAGNQCRDALVTHTLRGAGWRVLRIWEHELARKQEARLLGRLRRAPGLATWPEIPGGGVRRIATGARACQ